jgi:hypothetical protein
MNIMLHVHSQTERVENKGVSGMELGGKNNTIFISYTLPNSNACLLVRVLQNHNLRQLNPKAVQEILVS